MVPFSVSPEQLDVQSLLEVWTSRCEALGSSSTYCHVLPDASQQGVFGNSPPAARASTGELYD